MSAEEGEKYEAKQLLKSDIFFRKQARKKINNPGPSLKHSIGCGHFQPHVRWLAKQIITWESEGEREREREVRAETSTPVLVPGAPPPFSDHNPAIPQGKVWPGERQKGGEKGRGRKRLWERFTGLFNRWLRLT